MAGGLNLQVQWAATYFLSRCCWCSAHSTKLFFPSFVRPLFFIFYFFLVCANTWSMCAQVWWNIKLANGSDHTLSCWRVHWGGYAVTRRPVCRVASERTGPHCLHPSPPPRGYLTQNNIMHKVCFLGLQKSCRHLVLDKGQIIHHSALPLSSQLYSPFSVALISFILLNSGITFSHCHWSSAFCKCS